MDARTILDLLLGSGKELLSKGKGTYRILRKPSSYPTTWLPSSRRKPTLEGQCLETGRPVGFMGPMCVQMADSESGDVEPALVMLDGLHRTWSQLLEMMTQEQYARTCLHPQTGRCVSLWLALSSYAWHRGHHTSQILWLRNQHGW